MAATAITTTQVIPVVADSGFKIYHRPSRRSPVRPP